MDKDTTRVVFIAFGRSKSRIGRFMHLVRFKLYQQFIRHFNFSDQDYNAMRSTRWQYPEHLSATDSHLVAQRRLVAEHARGIKRTVEVKEITTAERQVIEGQQLNGLKRENDYGVIATQETNGKDAPEAEKVQEAAPAGDGND